MASCLYCAQTATHKDIHGYCKVYDCFKQSGMKDKLDYFVYLAKQTSFQPAVGQVRGPVSNFYDGRTRYANNVMWKAKLEFGYVPLEVIDAIPIKHREQWDKNIRW